jgi:hypothetical protein
MTMMFVIIIADSVIVIISERENTEIKIKSKNLERKHALEQSRANGLNKAFDQLRLAYQKKAGLTFVEKKVDITWNGPSEPETWKPEDLYSDAVRIADKARVR